jgi:hypothetical protein
VPDELRMKWPSKRARGALDKATQDRVTSGYDGYVKAMQRHAKTPNDNNVTDLKASTKAAWEAVRADANAWALVSKPSSLTEVAIDAVDDLGTAVELQRKAKRMRKEADNMDDAATQMITSTRAELMSSSSKACTSC